MLRAGWFFASTFIAQITRQHRRLFGWDMPPSFCTERQLPVHYRVFCDPDEYAVEQPEQKKNMDPISSVKQSMGLALLADRPPHHSIIV